MTTKRKLELAGAGLGAVLLVVFFVQWISHREALIRAEEQEKAAKAQIAERDNDIAQRERDKQERDKETAQQIAQLQAQIASIRTPQQAAQIIPQYIPMPSTAPAGPLREISAADISNPKVFKPGDFILPAEDAIPLAQTLNKCRQDQVSLGTCQKDLSDTNSQLEARTVQFKLAQGDADRWKKVAKGGSAWSRTFKLVGYAACAGGGAWIGSKVQTGTLPPVVGAPAGVFGCHFVLK